MTPKMQRFVDEYLVDLNATQAAIRAGYSERTAAAIGAENLTKPEIQSAIAAARGELQQRTTITQDAVLKQLWGVATADPNELIEYRRGCCRYCWGTDFRYQRTANEMERDEEMHAVLDHGPKPIGAFDRKGGIGYHLHRPANPQCPECFGDGVGYTFVKDTRNLSAEGKLLYAGVKETKDGIEVKMHSPGDARQLVGRHLGMFKDKLEVTTPQEDIERLARALAAR